MEAIERDRSLFPYHIAIVIHQERERELGQRLRFRFGFDVSGGKSSLPLRKRVGYRLIHIGSALVADGPLQLAPRR